MSKKSSPVGLYRANITPIDRLIRTTVGRQHALEDVVEKLERNAKKRGGQHYLFIGPRGIGKTHFLSLIENEVIGSKILSELYTVIRFPEENNRILSFADILLGIVELLAEKENNEELRSLHESLSETEKDEDIIDAIVPRLRRYRKDSGKTLLLILENLDVLFTEQIKREQDIHRFRSFLMDSPCAALVGTSPVYFPGLISNKSPLYDFFDITPMEELGDEETVELIRKNLEWEERIDILGNFDELIPKIMALHTMTGGNPRLTVMLYELIAHDNLLDVKVQFQTLLDQISPFYQDRLKELAPQERALLETIALMRDAPRTPANIAAKMRMKPQQVSSLLKRMTDAGYLTVSGNPEDGRSRLYLIKEGFFDLWLAMSESRLYRKRLGFLSRFFEIYYRDRAERERKRKELWEKLEGESATAKRNSEELLGYLSDLGEEPERCESKLEMAVRKLKDGDKAGAGDYLQEFEDIKPSSSMFIWMSQQAGRWVGEGAEVDVQKWLDEMVGFWRSRRSGDLEKAIEIADRISAELKGQGLHRVRVELLKDALKLAGKAEDKIRFNNEIAYSLKMEGKLTEAVDAFGEALSISREFGDRFSEAATLNNISQIHAARSDYGKALENLEASFQIMKEIGHKSGEGATLNNISQIYKARGDYGKSLGYLEASLQITKDIGDRSGETATLNNLSQIYKWRGDDSKALECLEEALRIAREIGDRSGEGTTLNNISQIYDARGDYGKALEYLDVSLKIMKEIGDRSGEGATLNNIGQIYKVRGDHGKGLEFLEESLQIMKEIGNRSGEGTTLNNIGQIYKAQGEYGRALEYLEASLRIREEIGDKAGMMVSLHNISMEKMRRDNTEDAIKLAFEAWNLALELESPTGLFRVGRALGSMLVDGGKRDEGLKIMRIAYKAGMSAKIPAADGLKKKLDAIDAGP